MAPGPPSPPVRRSGQRGGARTPRRKIGRRTSAGPYRWVRPLPAAGDATRTRGATRGSRCRDGVPDLARGRRNRMARIRCPTSRRDRSSSSTALFRPNGVEPRMSGAAKIEVCRLSSGLARTGAGHRSRGWAPPRPQFRAGLGAQFRPHANVRRLGHPPFRHRADDVRSPLSCALRGGVGRVASYLVSDGVRGRKTPGITGLTASILFPCHSGGHLTGFQPNQATRRAWTVLSGWPHTSHESACLRALGELRRGG